MTKKLKTLFPVFFWILLCVCIPMKASAANYSLSASDFDGTQRLFRLALSQNAVSDVSRALFAVWAEVVSAAADERRKLSVRYPRQQPWTDRDLYRTCICGKNGREQGYIRTDDVSGDFCSQGFGAERIGFKL